MKVLLLGAGGMLATDLAKSAQREATIVAVDHSRCDVTESGAVARLVGAERPDLIVNASAYTAVDKAEKEQDRAMLVNGEAVGTLGEIAARLDIPLVHYSTDYVFRGDGRRPYGEDDTTSPVNAYGASKLRGEQLLAASGARSLVIRTQWLFGVAGKSFVRTMWDRARSAQPTRVVDDQWGRPTYTVDLARATWRVIAAGATGVLHVTNGGRPVSWFDLAARVFAAAGASELLTRCSTSDYPTPAARPAFSALDTSRAASLLGGELPDWSSAVDRFLAELGATALTGSRH